MGSDGEGGGSEAVLVRKGRKRQLVLESSDSEADEYYISTRQKTDTAAVGNASAGGRGGGDTLGEKVVVVGPEKHSGAKCTEGDRSDKNKGDKLNRSSSQPDPKRTRIEAVHGGGGGNGGSISKDGTGGKMLHPGLPKWRFEKPEVRAGRVLDEKGGAEMKASSGSKVKEPLKHEKRTLLKTDQGNLVDSGWQEVIRVQGKSGVLKILPKNNKVVRETGDGILPKKTKVDGEIGDGKILLKNTKVEETGDGKILTKGGVLKLLPKNNKVVRETSGAKFLTKNIKGDGDTENGRVLMKNSKMDGEIGDGKIPTKNTKVDRESGDDKVLTKNCMVDLETGAGKIQARNNKADGETSDVYRRDKEKNSVLDESPKKDSNGVKYTEINISYNMELTMAGLVQIWNEREIQLMVLLSFMLQFFLLFTGSLRRRNINGLLRVTVWLAYVAADLVAVYAIGLFSQYEDKYKLGRQSFGDTLPFLWVPFLLVHLGGQDTITAFSIEDNNLWLRHLLNLVIQVTLALYVFWKSIDRINSQMLVIAIFIFVAGIIKYGERTWALRNGSRDGLGNSSVRRNNHLDNNAIGSDSSKASYALQTVLLSRGLFVGRTVLQLGDQVQRKLEKDFGQFEQREEKLKIIVMELGMMYDLLYTKAMLLQRCTRRIFRCAAQISMVIAFVLFLKTEKHAHLYGITYTLFVGAIFMEACSVSMVIVSPWTRAHLKEGDFLYWLSGNASYLFKAMQCTKMQRFSISMGQYNRTESFISEKSTPTLISKVIGAFGLEKHWTKLRHIKHIEAKEIIEHFMELIDRSPGDRFRRLELGQKLNYTLSLPFEHALHRLDVYTNLHISTYMDGPDHLDVDETELVEECKKLSEECKELSNYMIYLMVVYPSLLPVSSAAQDVEPGFSNWLRNCGETTKLKILETYETKVLFTERNSDCLFRPEQKLQKQSELKRSLEEIKEMWVRLVIHAAGKCRGELHARQLGNGGELLTFVWLLMVHHGLGDVATELNLLTSDDPDVPKVGSIVPFENNDWGRREQPLYAFDFRQPSSAGTGMSREMEQPEQLGQIGVLVEHFPLGETEQNEAGTSSEIEQIDGISEIQRKDNARDSTN